MGEKSIELYFETTEREEIWKKMKAKGVEVVHGPKEEAWGQRTLRFFDPDNYIIEVVEPIEHLILRLAREKLSAEAISEKSEMKIGFVKEILKKKED